MTEINGGDQRQRSMTEINDFGSMTKTQALGVEGEETRRRSMTEINDFGSGVSRSSSVTEHATVVECRECHGRGVSRANNQ